MGAETKYYRLEACIVGNWEVVPGHIYAARNFRVLYNALKPSAGQRLRRIWPVEEPRPDYICNHRGEIQRWETRY